MPRSTRRIGGTLLLALVAACGSDGGERPPCLAPELLAGGAPPPTRSARLDSGAAYPQLAAAGSLDEHVAAVIAARAEPFDWTRADDDTLCAALNAAGGPLVVGAVRTPTGYALEGLLADLREVLGPTLRLSARDDRLGVLRIAPPDCADLPALRALRSVSFVETSYVLDAATATGTTRDATGALAEPAAGSDDELNPGLYDPAGPWASYAYFMDGINRRSATALRRHHMDRVHDELGLFGDPSIGVAVIDNGVQPEDVAYLSTGRGSYRTMGVLGPSDGGDPDVAAVNPQPGDFLGLSIQIRNSYDHGSRQSKHVQRFAPHADRATVRGASFPFLLLPSDVAGVSRAITALADDPEVQIASMSLGTPFVSRELERAIADFHARGKLIFSAGGTSLPILKDLLGIVFPATLPTTVSTTGLADTAETGGEWRLGSEAHGGPENDFALEPSEASSEATSSIAGMVATLWAIDPEQPRESILDALVRSSTFYRERGEKHPLFGWGSFDAYAAAERIAAGGCTPEP